MIEYCGHKKNKVNFDSTVPVLPIYEMTLGFKPREDKVDREDILHTHPIP